MNEKAFLLHLSRLPGIGPVGLRRILSRMESAGISLSDLFQMDHEELSIELKLSSEQALQFCNPESDPESDLKQYEELGIQILLNTDSLYPHSLSELLGRNTPILVYAIGNVSLLQLPAIGISGARRASEQSLEDVSLLCESVSSQGWVVVSGGARGADEAAHLAAIRSGPGTMIVLPTGVLKPKLRRGLTQHLEDGKAVLISEFIPEQGWTAGCAMQRNRILAALSKAVVLVEPGLRGGTSGTGTIARKLGLPLYILNDQESAGEAAEKFFKKGAKPISPSSTKPKQLVSAFQRAWEVSVTNRENMNTKPIFKAE